MADVGANRDPQLKDSRQLSILVEDSVHIYRGVGVCVNAAGYATPMGDDSGSVFIGVAEEECDNTLTGHSQGGKRIRVALGGSAVFTKASAAQTDLGLPVYAGYDGTVVVAGGSTNKVFVGIITEIISTSLVRVQTKLAQAVPDATHYIYGTLTVGLKLAKIANGDIVTNFHAPCTGELVSMSAIVTDPATTASKLSTLNLEIGTTNADGGALDLTSANMTPLGAVVDASAITGHNSFAAGDHISVEASSTTAFVEGEIELVIVYRQLLQA